MRVESVDKQVVEPGIESNSRFARAAMRYSIVALALVPLAVGCGGVPPDSDPLASIAASVDESERAPARLTESWRRTPETPLTFRPAVGENAVYLAQGDRLAAWNVADGRSRWPAVVLEADITAAPVAVGDQAVVATAGARARVWWLGSDSRLIEQAAVDAPITQLSALGGILLYVDEHGVGRLGASSWHTTIEGIESVALAPGHGLALATTSTGSLAALDLDDGSDRWQQDVGDTISGVAVGGDRAFVATSERGLFAFRVADGRPLWTRNLGTAIEGAPAVAQDLVWVAAFDARLHALKAGNGTLMGNLSVDLSSRNYLDLASYDPWVVVGALYGPWLAVRGPTRAERPNAGATRVVVRQPNTVGRPDLSVPAGVGPPGVAVVNGDGTVAFLQPQRAR